MLGLFNGWLIHSNLGMRQLGPPSLQKIKPLGLSTYSEHEVWLLYIIEIYIFCALILPAVLPETFDYNLHDTILYLLLVYIHISINSYKSVSKNFQTALPQLWFLRSQEWQKAVQLLVELDESLQSDVPLASSAWCFPEDQMWNSFRKVHQQHIVTIRAHSRGSTGCKYDLVELVLGRFYSK